MAYYRMVEWFASKICKLETKLWLHAKSYRLRDCYSYASERTCTTKKCECL